MEVSIVLGVSTTVTILGFVLLILFVSVFLFAGFMVIKGLKESKQYREVSLPGIMSPKATTNNVDEDSIESLDLDSYTREEEQKAEASQKANVDNGSSLPMPTPMPMPEPVPAPEPVVATTTASSMSTPVVDHKDEEPSSVAEHDLVDDQVFQVRESDKGTGVDSMMSTLNSINFGSIGDSSDDHAEDVSDFTVDSQTSSSGASMPSLNVPSLNLTKESPSGSTSGVTNNPFRAV